MSFVKNLATKDIERALNNGKNDPIPDIKIVWDELSEEMREIIAVWCNKLIMEVNPNSKKRGIQFGILAALELLWVRMLLRDGLLPKRLIAGERENIKAYFRRKK